MGTEVDLVSLIGQIGFPMAVSAYLLITVSKQINSLKEAVTELSQKIGELIIVTKQ